LAAGVLVASAVVVYPPNLGRARTVVLTSASAGPAGPAGCDRLVSDLAELHRALVEAAPDSVVCLPRAALGAEAGRPTGDGGSPTGRAGPPGAVRPTPGRCTSRVDDAAGLRRALDAVTPGARVCVAGDLGAVRLEISRGGRPGAPVEVVAEGTVAVNGITVRANNVVVDGFQVLGAKAPGIEITGNDITVRNNRVVHPTGGDFDGLRFFGNYLRILHNTIVDIGPDGSAAHADCMQTFTNGERSSRHVLIAGNRCEKIDNQCLMAEGPGDVGDGGGGGGISADWTWSNNVCDFGAAQGLMIESVQNVTVRNNLFRSAKADKAIGLDVGSTGARVAANVLGTGIDHEIGMDRTSRRGYQGPPPKGGP
jgi:hypothetical protein